MENSLMAQSRARHSNRMLLSYLATMALMLCWSGIQPFDRVTWLLEVFPVLVVMPLLWFSRNNYPLTPLVYGLIWLHAAVLIVGGAYSYARVPLGFWLADCFDLGRNPYDKIGHFMQGFVPFMVCREVLRRGAYVQGARMLAFLCLCVVLAVSASYELIECAAAVVLGQGADEFLGTQGDMWDTQSDMAFALLGGISALVLLSRWHNRQLQRLIAP